MRLRFKLGIKLYLLVIGRGRLLFLDQINNGFA